MHQLTKVKSNLPKIFILKCFMYFKIIASQEAAELN